MIGFFDNYNRIYILFSMFVLIIEKTVIRIIINFKKMMDFYKNLSFFVINKQKYIVINQNGCYNY